MKLNSISCSVCTVLAFAALNAQAEIITTSGAFTAATNPNRTLDTFAAEQTYTAGYTVSGGAYGGKVNSLSGGMVGFYGALFTPNTSESITINTFTGGVNAIGANFFAIDGASGSGQSASLSITVSYSIAAPETSSFSVTDASTFRGFIAPAGEYITSLVFSGAGGANYNTIDNLSLATATVAVPEPSQWALLMGSGLMLFGAYRRYRK